MTPQQFMVACADLIEIHTGAVLRAGKIVPSAHHGALTEQAATLFATLANTLRECGHEPERVAHFLDKLLFSFFAEEAGLLIPKFSQSKN